MATLRDAIKGKINQLVAQAAALTNEYNARQATIAAAVKVEEGRLETLGVYLDQDLDAAKKELTSIFDLYAADSGRAPQG